MDYQNWVVVINKKTSFVISGLLQKTYGDTHPTFFSKINIALDLYNKHIDYLLRICDKPEEIDTEINSMEFFELINE